MCSRLMLLLLCVSAGAHAEADPGMELARQVYDRPKGKDVSSVVKMVLTGKGSTQRERELVLFSVDKGGSERWSLMRFSLPTDVEGTGLLTMDHPGDASEQWLYLPALDRVRRISSSRKGGRFVGSDFFYEDLRDREPDMDTHTIAGGEKVGGLDSVKLVSVPVNASNSVYSKRIAWIHRDTLQPLRIDFFQKGREEPVKRLYGPQAEENPGLLDGAGQHHVRPALGQQDAAGDAEDTVRPGHSRCAVLGAGPGRSRQGAAIHSPRPLRTACLCH